MWDPTRPAKGIQQRLLRRMEQHMGSAAGGSAEITEGDNGMCFLLRHHDARLRMGAGAAVRARWPTNLNAPESLRCCQ